MDHSNEEQKLIIKNEVILIQKFSVLKGIKNQPKEEDYKK
jgi:hypothetical protein